MDRTAATPAWVLVGGGALVVIGSFLPWAEILGITVNGMDGDGPLTLILGVVIAGVGTLLLSRGLSRWMPMVAGVAALLTFVIFVVDYIDVRDSAASVGIGLWAVLLGSIVGAVGAYLAYQLPAAEPAPEG